MSFASVSDLGALKVKFQEEFGDDPKKWERFSRHMQLAAKGIFHTTPVSPHKFFTDPYYCGKDLAGTLFPVVLDALAETCSGKYVEAVLTGGIGCSKALDLETPIPTPTGWTTMGALQAGDQVYDEQGKPCTVTMAHPVRLDRPCYEVVFSDGAVIVADGEHNWWTQTRSDRRQGRAGAVRTTDEIAATLKHNTLTASMANHSVPVAQPIEGSARTFGVSPYILGLWLGDGGKEGTKFWTADPEIAEAFAAEYDVRRYGEIDYAIKGLREGLHRYGLVDNKRIPTHYQRAPVADRQALLQGLMDTDGHVHSSGKQVCFTSAKEDLAYDVFELVAGLGYKPTIVRRKTICQTGSVGEAWFIQFTAYSDRPVFRLPRKANKTPAPPTTQKDRARNRYIVDVRPVASRPVRCITVDSPNSLYLAGENFVVTHNTTIALLGTMYQIYVLSCMHNPQRAFGLMQSDEIVFIFQSLAAHLAKDVSFDRFRARLDESPYFQAKFPYNKDLKSVIAFPNRVIVKAVSGSDKAAISQNVFGGVIDEVNFMAVIKGSAKSIDGGVFDQAQALYDSIRRRRESRFMNQGELPGILYLVSSKRYPGQFTDRKADEARRETTLKGKTGIYIYDKRIWDVQPHKFGPDRFRVFTGDQSRQPFIYKPDEKARPEDEYLVLEVPLEYQVSFEVDILGALRDIGGTSTLALHPFILDTAKVAQCFGTIQSVISRESTDFTTSFLEIYPELFQAPDEPRFVHIDLAYRGDSAGVACAHIQQFQQIFRQQEYAEVLPVIGFDFVLEVLPPRGGEIIFSKIRMLIVKLRDLGLNIRWVTLDSFQSRDTIQILRTAHFMTGLQSIDTTSLPYTMLKTGFLDLRVRAPTHPRAQGELIQLEQDERTGKIDHPPNGCFTGETRVALADGTCPTFKELSEREDEFYVYAMGPEGIEIAPARNARVTKETGELVEVMLDNFQVIRCTPEHLFMTLDGEWVEAQHLTPDISIMPLYRSVSHKGGLADYERVWCPRREERILTHHLAVGAPADGWVVHHKDENKSNNDPRNLEHKTREAHYKHHAAESWLGDKQAAMRKGFSAYFDDPAAREASRQRMLATRAAGKLGPPAGECAVDGCVATSKARGLCDLHYQRAKRAKTLPARTSRQNHRVLSVKVISAPAEPVYDLTVPGLENFALASGVFVHNSKDCSDAMAGAAYGIMTRRDVWARHDVLHLMPQDFGSARSLSDGRSLTIGN